MRRVLWGFAFSAVVLAVAPAGTAQAEESPAARLTFSGDDWISGEESYAYTSTTPGTSLVVTRSASGNEITAVVDGPSEIPHSQQGSSLTDRWTLRLGARTGEVLGVGAYSDARRSASPSNPMLDLSGNGRMCSGAASVFDVHALTVEGGTVVRLDVSFALHCDAWTGPTRGRLLVGVSDMPPLPAFAPPATLVANTSVSLARWWPTRSLLKVRIPRYTATVRGSITCASGPFTLTGMLSQNNSAGHAGGQFWVRGTCTGAPQSWSAAVQSGYDTPFQPGPAGVSLKSYAGADSFYFVGAVVTDYHVVATVGPATPRTGGATAGSPAGVQVPETARPVATPAAPAVPRPGWSAGAAVARAGSAGRTAG